MSVKNAKTGALPHGWLEYTDERSGRSYYYNVHTKVHMTHLPSCCVALVARPDAVPRACGRTSTTCCLSNIAI